MCVVGTEASLEHSLFGLRSGADTMITHDFRVGTQKQPVIGQKLIQQCLLFGGDVLMHELAHFQGSAFIADNPRRALWRYTQRPARLHQIGGSARSDYCRSGDGRALCHCDLVINGGTQGAVVADEVTVASCARLHRNRLGRLRRQFGKLNGRLVDERTHTNRVDPNASLRRLAPLPESFPISTVKLLNQLEYSGLGLETPNVRHDSGFDSLVAVSHVQLEAVPNISGSHTLPHQVITSAPLEFLHRIVEWLEVLKERARSRVEQHGPG